MVVSQLGSLSGFTWKCGLSAKFSLGSPSAPTWSARIDDACLAGLYANMSIWKDHQRPFPPRNDHPDIQIVLSSSCRHKNRLLRIGLRSERLMARMAWYNPHGSWFSLLVCCFFSCTWVVNLNQHLLSRFLPWRLLLDYSNPTRSLPILSVCRKDNSQSSTGSPWIKNIKGGPLKPENRPNKRPFCPKKDISGENPQVWACTSETNELQFFFLKSISMQKILNKFLQWLVLASFPL